VSDEVSPERVLGGELVRAAEKLLATVEPETLDPAGRVHLAAVQAILGLYWELRHQHPGDRVADDDPVSWLSALLTAGVPLTT
jgi:hypothetical protein